MCAGPMASHRCRTTGPGLDVKMKPAGTSSACRAGLFASLRTALVGGVFVRGCCLTRDADTPCYLAFLWFPFLQVSLWADWAGTARGKAGARHPDKRVPCAGRRSDPAAAAQEEKEACRRGHSRRAQGRPAQSPVGVATLPAEGSHRGLAGLPAPAAAASSPQTGDRRTLLPDTASSCKQVGSDGTPAPG